MSPPPLSARLVDALKALLGELRRLCTASRLWLTERDSLGQLYAAAARQLLAEGRPPLLPLPGLQLYHPHDTQS
jgi:hypothetical protein